MHILISWSIIIQLVIFIESVCFKWIIGRNEIICWSLLFITWTKSSISEEWPKCYIVNINTNLLSLLFSLASKVFELSSTDWGLAAIYKSWPCSWLLVSNRILHTLIINPQRLKLFLFLHRVLVKSLIPSSGGMIHT